MKSFVLKKECEKGRKTWGQVSYFLHQLPEKRYYCWNYSNNMQGSSLWVTSPRCNEFGSQIMRFGYNEYHIWWVFHVMWKLLVHAVKCITPTPQHLAQVKHWGNLVTKWQWHCSACLISISFWKPQTLHPVKNLDRKGKSPWQLQ